MASLCAPGLKHLAILVDHLNFFYSCNDGRALESVQHFHLSTGNRILVFQGFTFSMFPNSKLMAVLPGQALKDFVFSVNRSLFL